MSPQGAQKKRVFSTQVVNYSLLAASHQQFEDILAAVYQMN